MQAEIEAQDVAERQKAREQVYAQEAAAAGVRVATEDSATQSARRAEEDRLAKSTGVETPPPLTLRPNITGQPVLMIDSAGGQVEVLVGTAENTTDELVRRAALFIHALGKQTKKDYGSTVIQFRDVQPGQKLYWVFPYRWVDESGTDYQIRWGLPWNPPGKATYRFDVTVHRITPESETTGSVALDVTNATMAVAQKVDLLLITHDRSGMISGFVRGEAYDVKPGQTKAVEVHWRGLKPDQVDHVIAQAQIGGDESGEGASGDSSGQMSVAEDPTVDVSRDRMYHRETCTVGEGKKSMGLSEAKRRGYRPCPVCNPPK